MKILQLALAASLISFTAIAQNVPAYSGGVGVEERTHIEAVQNQYSLKVIFSVTGGAFLSDVGYTVTDDKGVVVTDGVSSGPILLLGLPDGKYEIDAALNNNHQSQKVAVAAGKLKTIQFRFVD